MRLLFLAPANSIHTVRILNLLTTFHDVEVHLISQFKSHPELSNCIHLYRMPNVPFFSYIFCGLYSLLLTTFIRFDVTHSFYATGYGLSGLLNFSKVRFVSVWGSDILLFPKKSFFHRFFIRWVLGRYTGVFATSDCLVKAVTDLKISSLNIYKIPFGVDDSFLDPSFFERVNNEFVTIGIVKSLHPVYAIDTLIRAFYHISDDCHDETCPCHTSILKIAGTGPEKSDLLKLVNDLELNDRVIFVGHLSTSTVVSFLSGLNVFACFSKSESFGVSILEASAMCLPVITSNACGFKEVVINNITGHIIDDIHNDAHHVLHGYVSNSDLCVNQGLLGRNFVTNNFTWDMSIKMHMKIYSENV